MKWSKYNYLYNNGNGQFLLYNCATGKLMVMVKDLRDLIIKNTCQVDRIATIHPELYDYLLNKRFIIGSNVDETMIVVRKLKKSLSPPQYFGLTINPTLACNLRCWYCYEEHLQDSTMSEEILVAVKLLIKEKIESSKLKIFNLSFFGGEPLLKFKSVVLPLINYSYELCHINNVILGVSFTSNGVLLTSDVTNALSAMDIDYQFQIPFDGNKYFHDKIKSHPNGNGTYQTTVDNIKYALQKGLNFIIRCNYSNENIISFKDLINDLKQLSPEDKNKISFSFHRIWQTKENEQTIKTIKTLQRIANRHTFKNRNSNAQLSTPCYADSENSVVINYNGDVYNCTARDFKSELREGVLNSDGTITYNDKHKERMQARFATRECLECKIFPICDICSQRKIENNKPNECLRMASEKNKEHLVLSRIKQISKDRIRKSSLL